MFDLNLEKYNIKELHELLQLSEPCSLHDIHSNSNVLKQSIEQDNDITQSKRTEVVRFLDKVVVKLTSHYQTHTPFSSTLDETHPDTLVEMSSNQTNLSTLNPSAQVVQSYPTKYPAGTHDPIYRETITHVVSIDSKFRSHYYRTNSSDFTVVLNSPIKNVMSMTLNALELPNSIFPISRDTGNNVFYIKDASDNEYQKVEIPNGQYNYDAIVNVLTFAINNLGGNYADYQVGHSDEPVNARIIIRSSIDGTGNTFSLKFLDDQNPNMNIVGSLGWILGFRLTQYVGNTVYAGEGLFDGGGIRYILMRVDDFNKNSNDYFVSNYTNSILKDNILARIQLRVPTFTINYNTASDMISRRREYFGPVTIERLHVQLLNEYGQLIDLNHMDYSFALELECLR